MRLDGIHHVTCITADAPRNVDFYTRVLGLRLVKKTVNQDDPTVYHLFYADEAGTPGSDITFFEYPGVRRGRAGAGMVHTRRAGASSRRRRSTSGNVGLPLRRTPSSATAAASRSTIPRGCAIASSSSSVDDAPLLAEHPEVPAEHALQGFDAVRAFSGAPDASRALLEETLGFVPGRRATRGRRAAPRAAGSTPTTSRRSSAASAAPARCTTSRGRRRSRSTRHGTRASRLRACIRRRSSTASGSARSTSASRAASSSSSRRSARASAWTRIVEHLGESLILPPAFEHLRDQVEPILTPLPDPRPWAKTA